MNKGDIITINKKDKKYDIVSKDEFGDFIKIVFKFEEEIFFGVVYAMSSSGNYTVAVRGRYGIDSENDLV